MQETHLYKLEHLQKSNGYSGFFVNATDGLHSDFFHGIGILVKTIYNPSFTRISPRVCTASFKINNKNDILFISGYAPTETIALTKKGKLERDAFYEDLQKPLALKKSINTIPIIALDANARTSYSNDGTIPNVIGKFTKGPKTNTNGHTLLHFAAENDMILTNTLFRHKMSRRTTFTAKYQPFKTANGEVRRSPHHNQIDYIHLEKKLVRFVKKCSQLQQHNYPLWSQHGCNESPTRTVQTPKA